MPDIASDIPAAKASLMAHFRAENPTAPLEVRLPQAWATVGRSDAMSAVDRVISGGFALPTRAVARIASEYASSGYLALYGLAHGATMNLAEVFAEATLAARAADSDQAAARLNALAGWAAAQRR